MFENMDRPFGYLGIVKVPVCVNATSKQQLRWLGGAGKMRSTPHGQRYAGAGSTVVPSVVSAGSCNEDRVRRRKRSCQTRSLSSVHATRLRQRTFDADNSTRRKFLRHGIPRRTSRFSLSLPSSVLTTTPAIKVGMRSGREWSDTASTWSRCGPLLPPRSSAPSRRVIPRLLPFFFSRGS